MTPTTFTRSMFSLNMCPYAFEGLTDQTHWNGWAKPLFELEQAQSILREVGAVWSYNEADDTFSFRAEEEPEEDTVDVVGQDIEEDAPFNQGIITRHVYAIGTGWWIWDDCTECNLPTRLCACGMTLLDFGHDCPNCGC